MGKARGRPKVVEVEKKKATTLNFRADDALKSRLERVARVQGVDLSSAIRMTLLEFLSHTEKRLGLDDESNKPQPGDA